MSVIAAPPPAPAWEQAMRQFGARFFEAAPGLVTWIMLLAPAWIPIIFHTYGALVVALAVLVFDVYWVFRAVTVVVGVYSTLLRMRRDMKKDWLQLCRQQVAIAMGVDPLDFYHLSVIPTYTEPYHVLERTVQAIVDANYPDELKLIGIITRETDKPGWENVARLKEKFGGRVRGFYHIKDPLEPGIVIGKSAAMNWGGRWMVRVLTDEGFDLNRVLITDLDSDYRVHPQYFAWISWHHARQPLRDYIIWQPVPMFHNNYWQVPLAVRIMSASTSQWQMFLHSQPHRLVAFSSYTCSLEFVHRVGYWDKDVIPEDSRFYWKAFFTFGKRFSVRSVWLPIYGDSPMARDYASTHTSQYNQIKRWAWGITDVPYVLARFFKHPEIPLMLRFRRFMNLFLNHLNWIFLPVLLMFGASIPLWASVDFSLTDIGQTVWSASNILLAIALSSFIFFLYFEIRVMPPMPEWPLWKKLVVMAQYLAYPIVGLVMSVLPALEAHTRLLLGRYLEYRVTEKV
jgi:cellulose synthase/poly-beta-1,6-N-acetylglucosamine synthase-like glycosyltransferase